MDEWNNGSSMPKWGCEGLLTKINWNGVTKVMVHFIILHLDFKTFLVINLWWTTYVVLDYNFYKVLYNTFNLGFLDLTLYVG